MTRHGATAVAEAEHALELCSVLLDVDVLERDVPLFHNPHGPASVYGQASLPKM